MSDKFDKKILTDFIKILENSNLSEMEFKLGNEIYIKLKREITIPAITLPSPLTSNVIEPKPASKQQNYITSPVVGKIYLSSSPKEAPFVKPGDKIEEGQTIFIIEAMKVMNNVKANKSGIVDKILVQDGEPVEYGQQLLLLK